jgi:hypothetical protein
VPKSWLVARRIGCRIEHYWHVYYRETTNLFQKIGCEIETLETIVLQLKYLYIEVTEFYPNPK